MSDPITRKVLPRNVRKGTKFVEGWVVKELRYAVASGNGPPLRIWLFLLEREVDGDIEVMQEWFKGGQLVEVIV